MEGERIVIARLVIAIAYGIAVFIVVYIIGAVLATVGNGPFDTLGSLLERFAPWIGILAVVVAFFGGASWPTFRQGPS